MPFDVEKTEEVISRSKLSKLHHRGLTLNNKVITKNTEHKHLCMNLNENLDFKSHFREAILKARKEIGLIKFLSKYISRNVLE